MKRTVTVRASPAALRPRLQGLATALPPHVLRQADVAAEAARMFASHDGELRRMLPVFANAGIEERRSVRPLEWFRQPRGWPERTEAYLQGGTALFVEAAAAALEAAACAPEAVDTVICVSSTGIATPSLEARAHARLGLRSDVRRVPVFGLGCAGGVTGLSLAARLARAAPGETVLLVALETCTLAFRDDALTKANVVATALFGDGAAAAVVSTGGGSGLPELEACGEHLWPQTLDIMGWRIDPIGFGAVFSQSIPDVVTERLRPATEDFLGRNGLQIGDIDGFVLHPGGARVVNALEAAFRLPREALDEEREVLRRCGNMSAPTVLFVLERKLAGGLHGRGLLCALGPGFTASFLTFRA